MDLTPTFEFKEGTGNKNTYTPFAIHVAKINLILWVGFSVEAMDDVNHFNFMIKSGGCIGSR